MPGFQFRLRPGNKPPTVRSFALKSSGTLSLGDFVNYEDGRVDVAVAGDTALLGVCQESRTGAASDSSVRVIVDLDAIYGVHDAHARTQGESVGLTGSTGEQGVASNGHSDLVVMLDCTADEDTHVRIDGTRGPPLSGGELNAAITRAVVRSRRRHLGRGPTRAQAFHRGNIVVVVLEDVMTQLERTLANRGQKDALVAIRQAIEEMLRGELRTAVEDLTGCKVVASMYGFPLDPDMASEVFVLDRPVRGQHSAAEPDGTA
jgi:uncharacterized protein YbcI